MGWLERLFGAKSQEATLEAVKPGDTRGGSAARLQAAGSFDLQDEQLVEFLGSGLTSKAGKTTNERSAMANATFNRAVTLISSTIGMLPLNLYRKSADGSREKAGAHPVQRLLRSRPNSAQTAYQFKSYMQGRALLYGDAFAYIVPGYAGPQALWPLDPKRVTIEQSDDFSIRYVYQDKSGRRQFYLPEQIMHLRSPWSSDGLRGEGLLRQAAEALGLAEISDEAAARLLRNGAYVGGVLQHPTNLSEGAIERLRAQFEDKFSGVENTGRWVVAEEGMKVQALGVAGKDAEGLAQRKHQAEEISRFTGVPRPLLMFDETSWGSGIEQLGLFLVTYCLLPWFNA